MRSGIGNSASDPLFVSSAGAGSTTSATSTSVTPASDATSNPFPVVGNVASGVADSGNPVKTGGVGSSVPLTAVTNGQRANSWFNLNGQQMVQLTDGSTIVSFGNASVDGLGVSPGLAVRGFGLVFNGTNWDRQRGDVNATTVQPALSSSFWSYAAAAGGIVNTTTAVTVKAAAGAGVRNYVEGIQLSWDALTTGGEFAIRDGASGTVLWRFKIPSASAGQAHTKFGTPLRGTANTLLEVVTLTASGAGGVFVNLQGWTGV